ncbi:MAG: tetratricopeptide repeat protein [Lentisphaeria bacterium]|nr:tetratricopeptide repeat protein [Lentisphaeria bacterium]
METKPKVFLSYAHADADKFGREYIDQIKQQIIDSFDGGIDVFIDADELKLGNQWNAKIRQNLNESCVFICLVSESYLKSEYCTRERTWWAQKEMRQGRLYKNSLPFYYVKLEKGIPNALAHLQDDRGSGAWFPAEKGKPDPEKYVKERFEQADVIKRIRNIIEESAKLKKITSSVPVCNENFVGRVWYLCKIREACVLSSVAAGSIPVLHGEAGCGKSELARAYANGYALDYPGGCFWIPMENVKSWDEAWEKLAHQHDMRSNLPIYQALGFTNDDLKNPEFLSLLKERVWHQTKMGKILFVLDNLVDAELLSQAGLKTVFQNGNLPENLDIIVTSKKNLIPEDNNRRLASLAIENLEEEAAMELLRQHAVDDPFDLNPPEDDHKTTEEARKILRFLNCHAWSVSMISGYIATCRRYGKPVKEIFKELKKKFGIDSTAGEYGSLNPEELLKPSVEMIQEEELGSEILELAAAAAMFDPGTVSVELLEKLWQKRNGAKSCSRGKSWNYAWLTLKDYHLVSETNNQVARMHRLTRSFFLQLCRDKQKDFVSDIAAVIKELKVPLKNPNAVTGLAQYILTQPWKDEYLIDILNWIPDVLISQYYLNDAQVLFAELEKIDEIKKENTWLNHCFLDAKGDFYSNAGAYAKALRCYQESLNILEKSFSEKHSAIVLTNTAIFDLYFYIGDYDKAQKKFEEITKKYDSLLEEEPGVFFHLYDVVGQMYIRQKNFNKALEFLNVCLENIEKISNSRVVASLWASFGNLYCRKAEQEIAEDIRLEECETALYCCNESLEIYKNFYGEEHPIVATLYSNMACVYHVMKKYEKSLELHKLSLKLDQRLLPDNHPSIANSYYNIGLVYLDMNQPMKALEFFNSSLRIYQRIYEYHPSIADTFMAIGNVHAELNEANGSDKSLRYYNIALEQYQKVYGGNHPAIAKSYLCIGGAYSEKKNYDKALENYNKSLKIYKQYPEKELSVAQVYNLIGYAHYFNKNLPQALWYYKESLEIYKKYYSDDCYVITDLRAQICMVLAHYPIGKYIMC